MNYKNSHHLNNEKFKRLIGFRRETFANMLWVLHTAYAQRHKRGGCKPKLSLETYLWQLCSIDASTRTYEQIAADFNIDESDLIRRSRLAEQVPIQNSFRAGPTAAGKLGVQPERTGTSGRNLTNFNGKTTAL